MKRINVILFLLVIIFNSAQTQRFFYELQFKEDSTQIESQNCIMILDINPNETKYYDKRLLEKDSLNKLHNSQNTAWSSQIPVVRKKNSGENINFAFAGDQLYSYPSADVIDWKLYNETKKLAGFNVQKATTHFGGRNWIAWFTKEIPLSDGPYKFTGLPGLIISIEDDQQHYIFNLIKSEKLAETYDTSNILEIRYGDKPLPISEKTFIKKSLEYYADPLHEDREELSRGKTISIEIDGKKYTKASELIPLIIEEQAYIRKNNNPIEKNKAIKYPVK